MFPTILCFSLLLTGVTGLGWARNRGE